MTGEMERLEYRDRFVKAVTQDFEGYVAPIEPPIPQVISGDSNIVILDVSLEEWTKLLSSVFTGADICYTDKSDSVRWILLRAVEQPMAICELIIDCITNDADTRAALSNWLASDPDAAAAIQEMIDNGTLITGTGVVIQTNDLDALFGAVTYVTDTMNDAITEFYQDYETTTNRRERGNLIFSAIPVVETLPVDEIDAYIDKLEEEVAAGYADQWSTTPITGSRDRIRCALFCAARLNDNTLTWSMIEDYFWGRVGFTPENIVNVIAEFVLFMATGSWSGQEIVDISMGNFAAAMRQGQKFGEETFPSLAKIMQMGLNDPDPDWELVCEDCDEPPPPDPECEDLTADEGEWSVDSGNGVYIDGEGFRGLLYAPDYILWAVRANVGGIVERIVYKFTEPTTNVFLYRNGIPFLFYDGPATDEVEFSADTFPGSWVNVDLSSGIGMRCNFGPAPSQRFIQACLYPPEE